MKHTKTCDACHKVRKLYFFKNVVDMGYVALCHEDAVKAGYMSDTTSDYKSEASLNMGA